MLFALGCTLPCRRGVDSLLNRALRARAGLNGNRELRVTQTECVAGPNKCRREPYCEGGEMPRATVTGFVTGPSSQIVVIRPRGVLYF